VVLVGGFPAAFEGGQEEELGDRVGDRVRGLGQHRAGAADDAGDRLGQRDPEIGDGGDDHREGGLAATAVLLVLLLVLVFLCSVRSGLPSVFRGTRTTPPE